MRDEDLERAILQRDVTAICCLVFEGNPPILKSGFRTETGLWGLKPIFDSMD